MNILIASPVGDTHLWGVLAPQVALSQTDWQVHSFPECSPEELVVHTRELDPRVIVLTCLLTTGIPAIARMLMCLRMHDIQVPVILGGVPVDATSTNEMSQHYLGPLMTARNADHCAQIISHFYDLPEALPPAPPSMIKDFSPRIREAFDLTELWRWIPPRTLYTLHLGYKGPFEKHLTDGQPEALALFNEVEAVKSWVLANGLIQPKALSQWVQCQALGDDIELYLEGQAPQRLTFPRQLTPPKRCLSDYVSSTSVDVMGVLFCTAGSVRPTLNAWVQEGRYQEAKILHALCVQTAEALTELIHFEMRQEAGLPDQRPNTEEITTAHYTGKRFSYGYSACPDLTQQARLFEIFNPEMIGITLSPLCMMAPEASVSALIFRHPEASYFSI